MHCRKDMWFMNVQTSKNAELFYKACEDIWAAERTAIGSPNIAVWLCTQAIEKTMKGYLRCLNRDYDYGHELKLLLDEVLSCFRISEDAEEFILYLNRFGVALRYKNMPNDPSPEDARLAITRTKHIMSEFNGCTQVSQFMDEAKEVHAKILKANNEKYAEIEPLD